MLLCLSYHKLALNLLLFTTNIILKNVLNHISKILGMRILIQLHEIKYHNTLKYKMPLKHKSCQGLLTL